MAGSGGHFFYPFGRKVRALMVEIEVEDEVVFQDGGGFLRQDRRPFFRERAFH